MPEYTDRVFAYPYSIGPFEMPEVIVEHYKEQEIPMLKAKDNTKPSLLTEYDGAEARELTEEELALLEFEKKKPKKPDPQDAAWDYQP